MTELSIAAIGVVLLGYLLGSVPFGLLLSKAAGLGDIRKIGSGNIGATNVLRTGNKPIALATLLLDGGKAAAAFLIAQAISPKRRHWPERRLFWDIFIRFFWASRAARGWQALAACCWPWPGRWGFCGRQAG
nr:glycerol-3-phosphate acyltransferase [Iodidimonas nitroreducens]